MALFLTIGIAGVVIVMLTAGFVMYKNFGGKGTDNNQRNK